MAKAQAMTAASKQRQTPTARLKPKRREQLSHVSHVSVSRVLNASPALSVNPVPSANRVKPRLHWLQRQRQPPRQLPHQLPLQKPFLP